MTLKYFDTRQLEAFSAVVSIGSMTGAARALGRSQPAISRLIQDLEADVGFALLHRHGPRIAPTAQGISFYEHVDTFLSGLRAIAEKAETIAARTAPPIEIASVPALATSLLPAALEALPATLRPAHIHIHSTASENVVQAVVARTADLGLASAPMDNPGAEVHWQAEAPCVAVMSTAHPLAGRDILRPEDLRAKPLIVAANPYRLRLHINEALDREGIVPSAIIDTNATYVSLSLARRGLGIAIVESLTGSGLPLEGVRAVPLSFRIAFRWSVITALGRPLSPVVEAIIERLSAGPEAAP